MSRKTRERKARLLQARYADPSPSGPEGPLRLALRWGLYPLVLGALAVAVYANSLEAPFIFDDYPHIVREARIKPPLSLVKILSTPRPTVSASLAANHAFGGLNVRGYHLLNLGAHLACGLLLYGFVRYTLRQPVMRARFGRQADVLAAAVAALFLVHPVQTESVTYVIQRAEIFASIALVACVWLAALAARSSRPAGYLAAVAVIGVAGLLSKPSIVVLPLLFALYDWCFIAEGRVREITRRRALYATLAGLAVVAVLLGVEQGAEARSAGLEVRGVTGWRYLVTQTGVLVYYVRLMLWPDRLCFDCGYLEAWPVVNSLLGKTRLVPLVLLAAGVGASWAAWRRHPFVTFGVIGSLVVLAPTSSFLVLTDLYVEHRLYLVVGLLALVAVAGAFAGLEALAAGRRPAVVAGRSVLALATVVAIGGLASVTVTRNEVYQDVVTVWQDVVDKAPQNSRPHYNLANEYRKRGLFEEAIPHYQESIRLSPRQVRAYTGLAFAYQRLGRQEEAIEILEIGRQRSPKSEAIHRLLARAYRVAGRKAQAVKAAEETVRLAPKSGGDAETLARLYEELGRPEDARRTLAGARLSRPEARRPLPGEDDLGEADGGR